jgi:hypothetical protein
MSKKKTKSNYSPAVQAALAINTLDLRYKADREERVRLNKVIEYELQQQKQKQKQEES